MIVFCDQCFTAVRVDDHGGLTGVDSEYWPDKYTCCVCDGHARGMLEEEIPSYLLQKMHVRDMTDTELYAALNGMGPPEDMCCKALSVKELLLQHKVVDVKGFEPSGTERFIIDHLVLDNGDRIYLGASPLGAVVYRISRKVNYTQRVLEAGNE